MISKVESDTTSVETTSLQPAPIVSKNDHPTKPNSLTAKATVDLSQKLSTTIWNLTSEILEDLSTKAEIATL